ncbi:MAG: RluA family pseudouridine synthase [Acidobacteriota bacterium]|nr:RluA family pseudouridine synthase [Acidobacteriota bacterium]
MALNRGWSYREQVGPAAAGLTALDYLATSRTHSTATEWADRFERGEVEIDGARAEPAAVLQLGHTIVWHRPPWAEPAVPTQFAIIHEDESLVAVDKPSGLPTMPAGGFLEHTLMNLLRQRLPEASPLHRLGRCTSGLVLFARTHAAGAALAKAWRDHEVKKTYRALASGVANADRIEIDAAIGPVPHPQLGRVYAASADGKASHSVATVLERRADHTLFSVAITTGRPHQIRIHLACAGHPLVGDPLYDVGGVIKASPGLPGDGGYLLHAEHLAFVHPLTGAAMHLTAHPPSALLTRAGA